MVHRPFCVSFETFSRIVTAGRWTINERRVCIITVNLVAILLERQYPKQNVVRSRKSTEKRIRNKIYVSGAEDTRAFGPRDDFPARDRPMTITTPVRRAFRGATAGQCALRRAGPVRMLSSRVLLTMCPGRAVSRRKRISSGCQKPLRYVTASALFRIVQRVGI